MIVSAPGGNSVPMPGPRAPARRAWSRAAALLGLALLAAGISACAPVSTPARDAAGPVVSFDQQYIDLMAPLGQASLEMANIARTRAERPKVQQLAREIAAQQEADVKQLQNWRKSWFGSEQTPPTSAVPLPGGIPLPGLTADPTTGAADLARGLESLRAAPEPFDRAFLDAMIRQHESALAASKIVPDRAQHPELLRFAGDIMATQGRQVEQMRAWRQSWFGGG